MRFEPPIHHELLLDAVRDAYGIRARELRFEPAGRRLSMLSSWPFEEGWQMGEKVLTTFRDIASF